MKQSIAIVIFLLCSGLVNTATAIESVPESHWDRDSAMASVRSVNINVAVAELSDPTSLADGERTIRKIKTLEKRDDWPLPAREAAIFQFTQSLAIQPRDAVDRDIVQYLRTYQARVLIPHEDHGDAAVPLFNIRGAVVGVENSWLRSDSTSEAMALLVANPGTLVSNYLSADHHSRRAGYLDALQYADLAEIQAVQTIALVQIKASPELTELLAATAVITDDPDTTRRLLTDGKGAALAPALMDLTKQQGSSETAKLLEFAIRQAPAENAALAIAAWWPALRHDAATRELLIEKLSDDKLGSSVALALAQSPDIQTIRELILVASGDTAAARRAQMALDMNRNLLAGEVQK